MGFNQMAKNHLIIFWLSPPLFLSIPQTSIYFSTNSLQCTGVMDKVVLELVIQPANQGAVRRVNSSTVHNDAFLKYIVCW